MNRATCRVLLVEHDPQEGARLERMLASRPDAACEVERTDRLSAAMERLALGGVDIVLLDLSLPDSRGLEAFHRLHARWPGMPIVAVASPEEESLAFQLVRAGGQDYLLKSRDRPDAMLRAIRSAIDRVQAQRQAREREEHLRLLSEQMPCLLWTTDAQLHFTSLAGAGTPALRAADPRLVGRPVEALLGDEVGHAEFVESHRQAASGQSRSFDMRWQGRFYHVHVEPFRQQDGRLIGTVGVAVDVTDQTLVDRELRLTRRIQAGLFPSSPPQIPGFDIAGDSVPVAEAGGDYFDYFRIGDRCAGIVICDVGGHGLGPAMMMSHTRAYLRALALSHEDPGHIVSLVNRFLCSDIKEDRLVTLLLAKLDPRTRTLVYANAGHQAYLLPCHAPPQALEATGIPLNVSEEAAVASSAARRLTAGDLLILCTDGVTESLNREGSQFGAQRMLDVVLAARHRPSGEILGELFRAVRCFSGDQPPIDDMTAVIIKSL